MIRCLTVVLFFVSATFSYSQELRVVVDDQNHFVIESESFDLFGIQFESESGSLLPSANPDPSPFQFYLANEADIVTFGTLTEPVTISGSLTLPTRWDPAGEKDIGYLWGNQTADGWGAVEGHTYTLSERGFDTSPALPSETTSGAVDAFLVPSDGVDPVDTIPEFSDPEFLASEILDAPGGISLPEPASHELLIAILVLLPLCRLRKRDA